MIREIIRQRVLWFQMPSGGHWSKNTNMLSVGADCKMINQPQKIDCAEYTPGKDCCVLKQHVLETKKVS